MSIQITIQGTVIDFPSSGQSPNWAPAIIEFAQAVEQALSGVVGPYDVSPQVIDIQNGIPGNILALSFASSVVRSVQIMYSVYRVHDNAVTNITTISGSPTITVASASNIDVGSILASSNISGVVVSIVGTTITLNNNATASGSVSGTFSYNETESGTLLLSYDGSNWTIQREFMSNQMSPSVVFNIDPNGQMSYSPSSLGSTGYSGKLSFAGKALLQTQG
jgi:hypothetical protein